MKTPFRSLAALTLSVGLIFGACSAEVEEEGDLPNVEVTDEGSLPDVNVEPAEVNVSADTQQVVTPDVDVNAPGGGQ